MTQQQQKEVLAKKPQPVTDVFADCKSSKL